MDDKQSSIHNMQVRIASMEDQFEAIQLVIGARGARLEQRLAALEAASKPDEAPETVTISRQQAETLADALDEVRLSDHYDYSFSTDEFRQMVSEFRRIVYPS